MADLIIKPNSATGDKLILQDRAGGAVLTTTSSGIDSSTSIVATKTGTETLTNKTLTAPTIGDLSNLTGTLLAGVGVTGNFITATGGTTITTLGDYKVHTFLASGTFTVTSAGGILGSQNVEVLVVGGGGSGGGDVGGGGGAGGLIEGVITQPVTATGYTITVGDGGASTTNGGDGNVGSPSYFAQTAAVSYLCKGAGGGGGCDENSTGGAGGSGGGSGDQNAGGRTTGNVPAPGTRVYGTDGGRRGYPSGGGGGADQHGGTGPELTNGDFKTDNYYSGGRGRQNNIDGNNYYWAAGGGGADWGGSLTGGSGGLGGGGGGTAYYTNCADSGTGGAGGTGGKNNGGAGRGDDNAASGAGGENTGSGGGGSGNFWGSCAHGSGAGGKGIVIVKYKFQ